MFPNAPFPISLIACSSILKISINIFKLKNSEKNVRQQELTNYQFAFNQMTFQMNNQVAAQQQINEQQ